MPAAAWTCSPPLPRAAVALLLTLSAAACGGGPEPQPSGRAPVTVRPSLPAVASGVSQDGVPLLVNVTLQDGAITGVATTVSLGQNTPVRLTVLADVADRLLVEGYGLRARVTVDDPVQLTFLADRKGSFPVRLEDAGTLLTTLDVR